MPWIWCGSGEQPLQLDPWCLVWKEGGEVVQETQSGLGVMQGIP